MWLSSEPGSACLISLFYHFSKGRKKFTNMRNRSQNISSGNKSVYGIICRAPSKTGRRHTRLWTGGTSTQSEQAHFLFSAVCISPVLYNTRDTFSFSGRKVFYLVLVKNKQHSYIDGGNSIWSIPYERQHFNIYQSCKCICPLTQQSWVAQTVKNLPAMQEI